jgi:hypothetical protein
MAVPAIHPGEHLAEELEALDMSAAELARKLDVPTSLISLARAHSSGSTYRVSMTCGSLKRRPGNPSKDFPG